MPTEYGGDDPLPPNTVQGLGPEDRKLSITDQKRLGLLTGQEEDPAAPRKPGFMYGVDAEFPELDEFYIPKKDS
jgi:hypothetical protein